MTVANKRNAMKPKTLIALLIAVGISGLLAACGRSGKIETSGAWEIVHHEKNWGYRTWDGRVEHGYTNEAQAVSEMQKARRWSEDYDETRRREIAPGYWTKNQ